MMLNPDLLVADITLDGPAHRSGVREGWTMTSFCGTDVTNAKLDEAMVFIQKTPRPWVIVFQDQSITNNPCLLRGICIGTESNNLPLILE